MLRCEGKRDAIFPCAARGSLISIRTVERDFSSSVAKRMRCVRPSLVARRSEVQPIADKVDELINVLRR